MATTDVVTGAFSYTGSFIARRLLAAGHQLRTLTNKPRPPTDLAGKIVSAPLDFEDVDGMVRLMRGADTVYNTYWIHSNYGATPSTAPCGGAKSCLPRPGRRGSAAWFTSASPIPPH